MKLSELGSIVTNVVFFLGVIALGFGLWKHYDPITYDALALEICFAGFPTQRNCNTVECVDRVHKIVYFVSKYLFPEWYADCIDLTMFDYELLREHGRNQTYYKLHMKAWVSLVNCMKQQLGTPMDLQLLPLYSQCNQTSDSVKETFREFPWLANNATV